MWQAWRLGLPLHRREPGGPVAGSSLQVTPSSTSASDIADEGAQRCDEEPQDTRNPPLPLSLKPLLARKGPHGTVGAPLRGPLRCGCTSPHAPAGAPPLQQRPLVWAAPSSRRSSHAQPPKP